MVKKAAPRQLIWIERCAFWQRLECAALMRASKNMNSPKRLDPRLEKALAKMAERKGLRYVQTYLDSGAFDGPNREAVQRWIDIQRRALFLVRLGPVLVGIASVVAAIAAVIALFKS